MSANNRTQDVVFENKTSNQYLHWIEKSFILLDISINVVHLLLVIFKDIDSWFKLIDWCFLLICFNIVLTAFKAVRSMFGFKFDCLIVDVFEFVVFLFEFFLVLVDLMILVEFFLSLIDCLIQVLDFWVSRNAYNQLKNLNCEDEQNKSIDESLDNRHPRPIHSWNTKSVSQVWAFNFFNNFWFRWWGGRKTDINNNWLFTGLSTRFKLACWWATIQVLKISIVTCFSNV